MNNDINNSNNENLENQNLETSNLDENDSSPNFIINSTTNESYDNSTPYSYGKDNITNAKIIKQKRGKGKIIALALVACMLTSSLAGGGAAYLTSRHYSKRISEIEEKVNSKRQPILTSSLTAKNNDPLSIPEISQKVSPAVVGITTQALPVNAWGFIMEGQSGVGTGIILNEKGYILTNNHVISNAQTIKVTFNTGEEVTAELVNSDPNYDVAIIKIKDPNIKMPGVAEIGDSDSVVVGETAVAIGNPLGLDLYGSVSSGIISALDRAIDSKNKDLKFIQTDAAINPGNSGGPLLNSRGHVIGINTSKTVANGVEGLGFAIPINKIKPKFDSLMTPKIMLGITTRNITEDISKEKGFPMGVYVIDIKPYSSSEKAGLKIGDIITSFKDTKIKTTEELNSLKEKCKTGDIINLTVVRDGKEITIKITL